jgi:hypothetical protein
MSETESRRYHRAIYVHHFDTTKYSLKITRPANHSNLQAKIRLFVWPFTPNVSSFVVGLTIIRLVS